MKRTSALIIILLLTVGLPVKKAMGVTCVSPPFEYYMSVPEETTCNEQTIGVEFKHPSDELNWTINTVDAVGDIISPVGDGASFYLKITGTGIWGLGYMPHLYAPGDYTAAPLIWEESWVGAPAYTGSADGDISYLNDIVNYNPLTDYEPNLVQKTPAFASSADYDTLIIAQEQVFPGWWGGPWTEPDGEIITWTFGPFVLNSPSDFNLRILMSTLWDGSIYVDDNKFTVCANLPVRTGIPPQYYSSLQAAYNDADNEDAIHSQKIIFDENIDIDLNKSITLECGYDCDYADSSGVTTVKGNVTISNGTLTIQSGTLNVQ